MTQFGIEGDVKTSVVSVLALSHHLNDLLTGQEPILEFTVLPIIMVHKYALVIYHMIIQPLGALIRSITILHILRQSA